MPSPNKRPETEARIIALIKASQFDVTIGPTGEELAKRFGISKQRMAFHLQRMERDRRIQRAVRGYINCEGDPTPVPPPAKDKYDEYLREVAKRRKAAPATGAEGDA